MSRDKYQPPVVLVVDAETAEQLQERVDNSRQPNEALRSLFTDALCNYCKHPESEHAEDECLHARCNCGVVGR